MTNLRLSLVSLLLCAGCVSAHGADQWPARYHKAGATAQQLNEDGGGCLPLSTLAWQAVPYVGTLLANRSVDLDAHAACMTTKGYTVTP